jgi:glycosyltransferase involved in cell wall biosynthesis
MRIESVSIVVPIYNEEGSIPHLYAAIKKVVPVLSRPCEIVFVDDGSRDRSPQLLSQLAERDASVRVVLFRRNFGQTAAMSAGLELAEGEAIVTLDGDLQNDPTDIPMMIAKLEEGFDLVHGWRKNRQDALVNRKIPSKIANWLISRVTKFPVHDLGCTLKAIRREHAKDLRMYGEMHRFIPILAHWQGARCAEVVTKHHARQFGETKYGIWRTVRVILDLMTVKYLTQYSSSPMKLFGGIGLLCLLGGGLSFAATVAMKVSGNIDMTGNPLLLLSALAQILGVQFFALGLLGEVGARIYHECQNKRPYTIRQMLNFEQHTLPLLTDQRAA